MTSISAFYNFSATPPSFEEMLKYDLWEMHEAVRLTKLQTRLAPHGERGRRLLQTMIGIEGQRENERQQGILAKAFFGGSISPEEAATLPLSTQIKYAGLQKHLKDLESKAEDERLANERFSAGYKAIEDSDIESFNKIINDSSTPFRSR